MTEALQICHLGRLYFSSDTILLLFRKSLGCHFWNSHFYRGEKNGVSYYCMIVSWCFNGHLSIHWI